MVHKRRTTIITIAFSSLAFFALSLVLTLPIIVNRQRVLAFETALNAIAKKDELIISAYDGHTFKINGKYIETITFEQMLFSDDSHIYFRDYSNSHVVKKLAENGTISIYFTSPYAICGSYGKDLYRVNVNGEYYSYDSKKDELGPASMYELEFHRKDNAICFKIYDKECEINEQVAIEESGLSKLLGNVKILNGDYVFRMDDKILYYFTITSISPFSKYDLYFEYNSDSDAISFVDYFKYTFDSTNAILNHTNWS